MKFSAILLSEEMYRAYSQTVLFALLGTGVIIVTADAFFPALIQCPWARAGLACPTCGMTRDFYRMFAGQLPIHNPASFAFFLLTFAELTFRTFLLFKVPVSPVLIRADYLFHTLLFLAFFLLGLLWPFTT